MLPFGAEAVTAQVAWNCFLQFKYIDFFSPFLGSQFYKELSDHSC